MNEKLGEMNGICPKVNETLAKMNENLSKTNKRAGSIIKKLPETPIG